MKITLVEYRPVAVWAWELGKATSGVQRRTSNASVDHSASILFSSTNKAAPDGDDREEDEEEDVCGICRAPFDGCCQDCKRPGDECPLMWGECSHVFHMHCILKWLSTDQSKKQCPMDRTTWVTASNPGALPIVRSDPPLADLEAANRENEVPMQDRLTAPRDMPTAVHLQRAHSA
ncbi:uncharacterized protein L969DRAFT_84563 [Mixia osmundae IAM 14324]|uniref:Anaphase-promoting complex subunit 11 n=1 Tax=Mixia osmundae (strain CBS 9802 / IAM 14324 / JCM 22182 / KY 12970) TaxID=764103 RepID=G7E7B3_MIXOS|nr:uncharacterized protein L969DRAFT_84563 [Mixia osmundae IAM 14324]KEI42691.1 hypothetical protein L969DRAFT_84563 [Mixia osmundae IAM 14324]GAA98723.1 hypothetical protein E5Q_05411 [Mixia osmundae IAM 14324]